MHDRSVPCRNVGAKVLLAKDGVAQRAHHVAFYTQCSPVSPSIDPVDDDATRVAQQHNSAPAATEEDCTPAPHSPTRKALVGHVGHKNEVDADINYYTWFFPFYSCQLNKCNDRRARRSPPQRS